MAEGLLSFMHSPGPWLFGMLSIFAASLLLLVELGYRLTGLRRRDVWRVVGNAMRSGFRSGVRGYFAPFRKAPWLAAGRAYRDPAGRWWSPLTAWLDAVERIAFGPDQPCHRHSERDGPVR